MTNGVPVRGNEQRTDAVSVSEPRRPLRAGSNREWR